MNCLKNVILRALAVINFVSFMVFVCMVDSESRIPVIVCTFNIIWLGLFFFVNARYFIKAFKRDNRKKVKK